MTPQHFDATNELNRIRHHRTFRKRKAYQLSRLHKFRAELVELRQNGGSFRELALWLETKRVKVKHTTVMRYLKNLPELKQSAQPISEVTTHA